MSIDFILPDIGEGIVECELVEWLVKEGETIVEDQPIADVMTDKAMVQIPSMYSGIVEKLYYQQGDIAKVHSPLFSMTPDGEEQPHDVTSTPTPASVEERVEAVNEGVSAATDKVTESKKLTEQPSTCAAGHQQGKVLASPAVRRVARELNVNIHEVDGSGKKGRVYKDDIVAFTKQSIQQVCGGAQCLEDRLVSLLW